MGETRKQDGVSVGVVRTPRGAMQVVVGPSGLLRIDLPGSPFSDPRRVASDAGLTGAVVAEGLGVEAARRQLLEYFAGTRRRFDLPLDPRGTEFDRAVLAEVARVGFGEVRTYGEIARAVDRPTASRAVGAANGRNPLPIVVPCHRIVGAGGRLTGYGGGLPLKEALLALEGIDVVKGRVAALGRQASTSPSRIA